MEPVRPERVWLRPVPPIPKLPREHSRRNQPKSYIRERHSREALRARRLHRAPPVVRTLTEAGRTGSALRSALKAHGIDPKLARLVLLFEGQWSPRVADVAWALNVSASTASRWLDRAERDGLVDKRYDDFDRRGTWVRLTRRGTALRDRVQGILERIPKNSRPAGVVYGIRGLPNGRWDE